MAEQLQPGLPELDPDGSAAYWRQKEQELKTPFKGLLPPLSTEEKESLVASIRQYGVTHPVVIDEEGNILDGHHRHSVDPNAPTVVMPGLSQLEKQAFVMSTNDTRRNMSPEQRRELRKSQQKLCLQLKKDDPNRWTQEELSTLFAKPQSVISGWLDVPIIGSDIRNKTDARIKLSTQAKSEIVDRVKGGETQEQVAADYGVVRSTVSKVIKKANELHARDEDKARKTAKLKSQSFQVRQGDFRQVLTDVEQVSLILTDPPYGKEFLPLWEDLALWASSALADDGVLVAYSGQMYLPQVFEGLMEYLDYWWTGAVEHAGNGNLSPLGQPVRKVINKWKPLVMFVKKGGLGFERTFEDLVQGAGPKKGDHNWQQNEKETVSLVETFTKPGELVVDPFAGSGGFCRVAHELGRVAIGAEILG